MQTWIDFEGGRLRVDIERGRDRVLTASTKFRFAAGEPQEAVRCNGATAEIALNLLPLVIAQKRAERTRQANATRAGVTR